MTGDFDELRGLRRAFETVPTELVPALKRGLATEAVSLVTDSFDEQRDPYGAPWKQSLRARLEGGRTLSDTARLRNSITGAPNPILTAKGFELTTNVKSAAVHQHGATIRAKTSRGLRFRSLVLRGKRARAEGGWVTKMSVTIPRRQFMPEPGSGGLGPIWEGAFADVSKALLEKHFKP